MARYVCDTETDGLLPTLTTIHCAVAVDVDTGELHDFADQPGYRPIDEFLTLTAEADMIAFHNAIKFDVPAIKKIYPHWSPKGRVLDTLVLSRLVYPDIKRADSALRKKNPDQLPGFLVGAHSLKSWGYRLEDHKGDYKGGWETWSPAMHEYMVQDARLGLKVWKHLAGRKPSPDAVEIEHAFAEYLFEQETYGYPFDEAAAEKLYAQLAGIKARLETGLRTLYQPWFASEGVIKPPKPRRYWTQSEDGGDRRKDKDGEQGYWNHVEGPYTQIKLTEFNPSSRHHIANRLTTLRGWVPQEFTKDGHPKVDDVVISQLPYPEAPQLAEYLMVAKRLGQLGDGKEGWLKAVKSNGRIHGEVIPIGTPTARCTHRRPNITQVPKVQITKVDGKKVILMGIEGGFGWECRSLFHAPEGYLQVGADASGLELRCLGHYLARYDDGKFIKELLEGDIHQVNMDALQELSPNRDCSKTEMYALLYGAGDKKLGTIVLEYYARLGLTPPGTNAMKLGKAVRDRLARGLGIGKADKKGTLMGDLSAALQGRDWLKGIDGRAVPVRSQHSALNTLLQSAGSIAFKTATVLLRRELSTQGFVVPVDWWPAAHVHDEVQLIAKEGIANELGMLAVQSVRRAGERLGFRCPLDGEYKVGKNWAETH
jgi:hypothetical protein